MLNKRGDLGTEEIVKIVLAILVLAAIITLAVSLVKIVNSNLKQEQAQTTLEKLAYDIQRLPEGQIGEFLVESPADWVFVYEDKKLCLCSPDIFNSMLCKDNQVCVDLNKPVVYDRSNSPCSELTDKLGNAVGREDNLLYSIIPQSAIDPNIALDFPIKQLCYVHIKPVPKSVFIGNFQMGYHIFLNNGSRDKDIKNKDCKLNNLAVDSRPVNHLFATDEVAVDVSVNFDGCDLSLLRVANFNLLDENNKQLLDGSCFFLDSKTSSKNQIVFDENSGNILSFSCKFPKNKIVSGKYKLDYGFVWDSLPAAINGVSDSFDLNGLNINPSSICDLLGIEEKGPLSYSVLFGSNCDEHLFMPIIKVFDSSNNQINKIELPSVTKSSGDFSIGRGYVCSSGQMGKHFISVDIADLAGGVVASRMFEYICE